jgi:Fic family protein
MCFQYIQFLFLQERWNYSSTRNTIIFKFHFIILDSELTISETFFFASMIHLVFVKIHPWNDGNGRSGRLFEKWFLAQKLGSKAWFIQFEKYYYTQHETYYNNIRALGLEYQDLDYSKA